MLQRSAAKRRHKSACKWNTKISLAMKETLSASYYNEEIFILLQAEKEDEMTAAKYQCLMILLLDIFCNVSSWSDIVFFKRFLLLSGIHCNQFPAPRWNQLWLKTKKTATPLSIAHARYNDENSNERWCFM